MRIDMSWFLGNSYRLLTEDELKPGTRVLMYTTVLVAGEEASLPHSEWITEITLDQEPMRKGMVHFSYQDKSQKVNTGKAPLDWFINNVRDSVEGKLHTASEVTMFFVPKDQPVVTGT